MDAIKITNSHYLCIETVPHSEPQTHGVTNHIWIYDRSGSMTFMLPELAKDLIAHYKTVPVGDIISIGYFSGVGVYRFILKGAVKRSEKDNEIFAAIINQNKTSIGTTCFSEILMDADTVVKELSPLSTNFAMMFFTDGYPVVPDYNREIKAIFEAIARIKSTITKAIFVGYGDYYNRELLSRMTVAMGGQLIHSSVLEDFTHPMTEFIGSFSSPRVRVWANSEFADHVTAVFAVDQNRRAVKTYMMDGGEVWIDPDTYYLYYISDIPTPDFQRVSSDWEPALSGMYAAASIFSQSLQSDLALDVLSRIGDKKIIDDLTSSFTNDEFGNVENLLRDAACNVVGARFQEGRRRGYVPRRDRFCVLDLLDTLTADEDAKFYPYDKSFSYKRIGAKSVPRPGYPSFVRKDDNPGCSFTGLTWNSTRMNISIRAQVYGYVMLDSHCTEFGFASHYPTSIYRNYSVVTDGVLHTTSLPVSCSEKTYSILLKNKLVADTGWERGKIFVLNLKKIPVMNRATADTAMSAYALCSQMVDEKKCESDLKVLKWIKERLDPENVATLVTITPQQKAYLETQGITANGFNPPTDPVPPTDFYTAMEFDIKMEKFSSLPAVEKTILKDESKLTPSERFIWDSYYMLDKSVVDAIMTGDGHKKKLAVATLNAEISFIKMRLATIRHMIYRTKASIFLGKRWFPDLDTRDGATLKVSHSRGEFNFLFTIRDIRVDL